MDRRAFLAATGLVLGVPPGLYWVVGDRAESGITDPDHLWEPPDWPEGTVRAVGAVAVSAAVAGALGLAHLRRTSGLSPVVLRVATLLTVAGATVALGYRVVTAGVGGANIGGGLVLLFGPPLVLGLVVAAIVTGVRGGRGRGRGSFRNSPR